MENMLNTLFGEICASLPSRKPHENACCGFYKKLTQFISIMGYCCFVTTRIADPTSSSLERPEPRCDAADVSQM